MIYMKKMKFWMVMLTVITSLGAYAQEATTPRPSISVGVEAGLPLGDFKEGWNFGIGGSVKGALPVASGTAITLSAGYMSFAGKSFGTEGKLPSTSMIPIKAGIRYRFPAGVYFEPQLGYTKFKVGDLVSTGGFTYAANIGYLMDNGLDLSARYEAISKEGTTSFLGLRLGYNFSL
jgi:hypothetical protein